MLQRLRKLWADQGGATAVEYGLIVALIVLAMLGALSATAEKTITMWQNVAREVTNN